VIRYRPFINRDPPVLADIWRSQSDLRCALSPLTASALEETALAKPYFDRDGVLVAFDGERPVGFVHAGWGPNDDRANLDPGRGVIALLMVHGDYWESEVPRELLARGEAYLVERGAKEIQGPGGAWSNPFYLGLIGGSESLGVFDGEPRLRALFASAGYRAAGRFAALHLDLRSFRPAVSRQQMQLRRRAKIEAVIEPPAANWWEACLWPGTAGRFDSFPPTRYELTLRPGEPPVCSVVFWALEGCSQRWGTRAAGLIDLQTSLTLRRQGAATCLVSEAIRQLQSEGFSLIEAQVSLDNSVSLQLFRRLGFVESEQGTEFRKTMAGS